MQVTISRKFQVTIPVKLRDKFHLRPGMKLVFDEHATELRATPMIEFNRDEMRRALGAARDFEPGKTSDEILRELRGYERRAL